MPVVRDTALLMGLLSRKEVEFQKYQFSKEKIVRMESRWLKKCFKLNYCPSLFLTFLSFSSSLSDSHADIPGLSKPPASHFSGQWVSITSFHTAWQQISLCSQCLYIPWVPLYATAVSSNHTSMAKQMFWMLFTVTVRDSHVQTETSPFSLSKTYRINYRWWNNL